MGAFSVPFGTESEPHRVHNSPVCVFKQQEGPVVCLVSGIQHGDITGTTALQSLVDGIDIKNIKGTLIVCPAFIPAQLQSHWNIEDRNAVKEVFTDCVLSAADVIIEISSGSSTTQNTPHVCIWPSSDESENELSDAIMFAMGAPDCVRRFESPAPMSLAEFSKASNTTYLKCELGQFATTDKASRLMGIAQCQNALLHIGVLTNGHFNLESTRILESGKPEYKIKTPVSGLVHWHVDLGGAVYRGNPIAQVYDVNQPFAEPVIINAPINGILLTKFHGACCSPGQWLAEIADEVPR